MSGLIANGPLDRSVSRQTGKRGNIMSDENKCELCGEPMPAGEEMFKLHGYSGPCPKPPLPRDNGAEEVKALFKHVTGVDVSVTVQNGEFYVTDPDGQEFRTGLVRKH